MSKFSEITFFSQTISDLIIVRSCTRIFLTFFINFYPSREKKTSFFSTNNVLAIFEFEKKRVKLSKQRRKNLLHVFTQPIYDLAFFETRHHGLVGKKLEAFYLCRKKKKKS